MKKNITINLCGRLFNIDEDAYELLRHYTETLRNYFGKQQGGSEIADDIEERIAELLDELKRQGVEAVNIEHVKQVITRIGQPEEMDGSEPDDSPDPQSTNSHETDGENVAFQGSENENGHGESSFKSFFSDVKELFRERRFYRNPKDKMIAGVLSGLASSFEIDVTLLRLLVIVGVIILSMLGSMFGYYNWHVFFNANVFLTFAVIYVIMAIIMPEAETPEQQLKMQGKPVNMQNLAEEVVQNVSETDEKSTKQSGCLKSVFNGILKFLSSCLKIFLILLAAGLFFTGVAVLLMGLFAIYSPSDPSFISWDTEIIRGDLLPIFVGYLMALLASLLIPAYAIIQHLVLQPLKIRQRIGLIFVWLSTLAIALVTYNIIDSTDRRHYQELKKTERINRAKENERKRAELNRKRAELNQEFITEEGVTMKRFEYRYLQENGWKVVNAEGCNNRFTAHGEYYVEEDCWDRYLDCYDEHSRQRYRVERTDTLMPGRYYLHCAARANGRGAFVYQIIDGKKQLIEIPATGNIGGSIWQEAKKQSDSIQNNQKSEITPIIRIHPMEKRRQRIATRQRTSIIEANGGKGYGWNRLEFNPIVITKPTAVSYGLTSDYQFTGQPFRGQWFSACDFIIEKISE